MKCTAVVVALGGLLCAAAPPQARLGSSQKAELSAIEAPVDRVTVYSNRARVFRAGTARLGGGPEVVRFPQLPEKVMTNSVRVRAQGARVLRAEVAVVETEAVSIAALRGPLEELEAAQAERQALVDAQKIAREQASLIENLQPAALVPEAQREGRPRPAWSVKSWLSTSDYLVGRVSKARDQFASLTAQLRRLDKRIGTLKTDLKTAYGASTPRRLTEVFAVVDAPKRGSFPLTLEYDVRGASWQPAYDLHYTPHNQTLAVFTGALVQQKTGEDWAQAKLTLSTGLPDESIALPTLLTWTLGEQRDFMPEVRPDRRPPPPPPMTPPSPRRAPSREALVELQKRAASALGDKRALARHRRDKRSEPRPPPAPIRRYPSPTPMAESRAASDEAMVMGAESTSSVRRKRRRRKSAAVPSRRTLPLTQATLPDKYAGLPSFAVARETGGIEYLYDAPARVDIHSGGERVRVPVGVERFETEAFYEATPGLSPIAYLKARITNGSTRPMIAGRTQIFVGGRFVGEGNIRTTAPQKQVEFGLGADESIKLNRKVLPQTRQEGVFSKHSITRYRTVIEAANYGRSPANLEVLEPLPKSTKEDIEIRMIRAQPEPTNRSPGILKFSITVAPGAVETIELIYEIDRPRSFELRQR